MADKQNKLKLIRMNEVEATEIDWRSAKHALGNKAVKCDKRWF